MKGIICFAYLLLLSIQSFSQKKCGTSVYFKNEINKIPGYKDQQQAIEDFTNRYLNTLNGTSQLRINGVTVIKIPVVVHVLYHSPGQKISDDIISNQIKILNRDFRRKNPDTVLTPLAFKNVAADCEIEFQLATSDPWRFSTNGIIKKYTPVETWEADDKMKFDSEMGSNAWDSKKYLNIWVCNMGGLAGYSTLPGGDSQKDGVVIDFGAFNSNITGSDYNMGRTAVHEVGHWLNLKHIWGDSDCGDDGVSDTPKQEIYTVGCPTEIRKSCNNGAAGNMYMNYMDFTNDACMNMFSNGQKARMRSLFATGGVRESMLNSTGLSAPLVILTPIELPDPKWLFAKIYPNPVSDKMIFNLEYDSRWIGKSINVTNLNGQIIKVIKIPSKDFEIDLSALPVGVYFLTAKKEDGDIIRHKFIKI
jgi:hypothetical protein